MDALKKLLTRRKADKKFKAAGPGHRLNEASSVSTGSNTPQRSTPNKSSPKQREGPTEERKAAAEAALARLEQKKSTTKESEFLANRQLKFIREQARKQIEAEKRISEDEEQVRRPSSLTDNDGREDDESYTTLAETGQQVDSRYFAVNGVYFTCPIVGPAVGTRAEIEAEIFNFLIAQTSEDLGVTSCLLIHSCNKGREKIEAGIDTLCKYLDNIINSPTEPKYRKIRCSNKIFQEKVAPLRGGSEFLEAVGFTKKLLKLDGNPESPEEDFWVFEPVETDTDNAVALMTELRDSLKSTTPIKPEVDRNVQVLMPAQVVTRKELPQEFYNVSGDELQREQRRRTDIAERELRLRTKAQRERDEMREQRLYRYCLIRVRFPDGFTLQGTFKATDKVEDIYAFVRDSLNFALSKDTEAAAFCLKKTGEGIISESDASLSEAHLPPASLLTFILESDLPSPLPSDFSFLRAELLALVQPME